MINSDRPPYEDLEARFGAPVGVEEARGRWGSLVDAATNGSTVLITRERWEWAALVPLSNLSGVLSGLPVLSLSAARSKLGELVRQAVGPHDEPVLLTRHRTPVVALIAARRLLGKPGSRPPVAERLLAEDATITLARDVRDGITAIARDRDGNVIAAGSGDGIAQALRSLGG
ncbi:hypothetical protein AB0C27_11940 [Nonomuraea sp. NPDC048882]|uniref:hypothetical protein n=1 Tax=unclassified Nonomuraea TaxID=2593643 RepID=UPI000B2BAC7C